MALDSDPAPQGYDPLLYSTFQSQFFSALYDSLFVTQKDGSVKPSLVSTFDYSADKTRLTLKLRSGVIFTDGSTLDASVVKKNLDRRTDAALTSYGVFAKGGSVEITDVAAPDASTVVLTFAKPQASAEINLADEAGMIVGSKGLASPASLKATPDGSGPYTLDTAKTTKPNTYTFAKNAKAWNAKSYPYQSVVFKPILDPQARANAVISGQVDVAFLDPSTADFVKTRQSEIKNGGTLTGFPVFDKLGKTSKPFGDVRVRQALMYAIDREKLVNTLHKGALPTASMFPAAAAGHDETIDTQYPYDPAKAKQLLAAAGYPGGFSFPIGSLGQNDTDLQAVQTYWKAVGVTLKIQRLASVDAAFALVTTQPLGFGVQAVNDPLGFAQGVLVGGFMNLQQAKDPMIQSAMDAAAGSTGAAKTTALTKLNAAITTQVWYLPLYESFTYYGYNAKKVAAPAFAGTNNFILLSSLAPAS